MCGQPCVIVLAQTCSAPRGPLVKRLKIFRVIALNEHNEAVKQFTMTALILL